MSNRIYIPPKKDPRLPLVQPRGVIRPQVLGAGGPVPDPNYEANWVHNGFTGFMTSTNFIFGPDSNRFIWSQWMDPTTTAGDAAFFTASEGTSSGSQRFFQRWALAGSVQDIFMQIGNNSQIDIYNNGTDPEQNKNDSMHFLLARDGTTLKYYINGVAVAILSAPTAATQPFASEMSNLAFPCGADGSRVAQGELTDVWYYPGEYLDFDIPSNLAKFINGAGDPVDLGANGEFPVGTSPPLYCGGSMLAADWNSGTNLGTGGALTHNGAQFTDRP